MAIDEKMFKTISSKCADEDVVFVSVKKTRPQKGVNAEKVTTATQKQSRNLTTYQGNDNKQSLLRVEGASNKHV